MPPFTEAGRQTSEAVRIRLSKKEGCVAAITSRLRFATITKLASESMGRAAFSRLPVSTYHLDVAISSLPSCWSAWLLP